MSARGLLERALLWFSAALASFPLLHAIIHSVGHVVGVPCP